MKISFCSFFLCVIYLFLLPFFSLQAAVITGYTLNGRSSNVILNPNNDSVSIELSATRPLKWSTIAICMVSDTTCSRSTSVKYFTQTSAFSSTVSKTWDGKTGGQNPVAVSDGDYKIRITAKDESDVSVDETLSSPLVTISTTADISGGGNGVGSTPETATTSGSSSGTTQVFDSTSTHSSSAQLSTYDPIELYISAGRERIGFTHTPLRFKTKAVNESGKSVSGAEYNWSFGDGTSGSGEVVKHTYLFPGMYHVVVNSSSGIHDAVSRSRVRIVEPSLQWKVSGFIAEVKNISEGEENIGTWRVERGNKKFVVAEDTILSPGQEIRMDISSLGEGTSTVVIRYPDGVEYERVEDSNEKEALAKMSLELDLISRHVRELDGTPKGSHTKKVEAQKPTESFLPQEPATTTKVSQTKERKSLFGSLIHFFGGILH